MKDLDIPDEFIIEHVSLCVEDLKKHDHGQTYKAEVLCREFWKDFVGLHTRIGMRIRQFEKDNRLPILYVRTDGANAALYRLK